MILKKNKKQFLLIWLCWFLFPELPRVFTPSMWAMFEKAVSSMRLHWLCPLMSHGSFYLSMRPLWQVRGWRAPRWQSMLGYTYCESLSRRHSQPFDSEMLLGYAGSCCSAARKPTSAVLVVVRPLELFQHLHFNSSVFRWGTLQDENLSLLFSVWKHTKNAGKIKWT